MFLRFYVPSLESRTEREYGRIVGLLDRINRLGEGRACGLRTCLPPFRPAAARCELD